MAEKMLLVAKIVHRPELRFTPNGKAVASFRVVQADRVKNKDTGQFEDRKPELFMRATVFGKSAENIVESDFAPGTRIALWGNLRQEPDWEKDGEKREGRVEFVADEVFASTLFAAVSVFRPDSNQRPGTPAPNNTSQQRPQQSSAPADDPWGAPAARQQPAASAPADDPWAAPTNSAPPADDPWGR